MCRCGSYVPQMARQEDSAMSKGTFHKLGYAIKTMQSIMYLTNAQQIKDRIGDALDYIKDSERKDKELHNVQE